MLEVEVRDDIPPLPPAPPRGEGETEPDPGDEADERELVVDVLGEVEEIILEVAAAFIPPPVEEPLVLPTVEPALTERARRLATATAVIDGDLDSEKQYHSAALSRARVD